MTVNTNADVIGGKFMMKDGSQTSAQLNFSIYNGGLTEAQITSGTNTPFASITLSNAQFDAQVSNGQNFDMHAFNFSSSIRLLAGQTYTAALMSAAPDTQNRAYFIKGGTQVMLVDSVTGAANTSALTLTGGTGAVTNTASVPEPSTYALMGFGAVALVIAVRRRTT